MKHWAFGLLGGLLLGAAYPAAAQLLNGKPTPAPRPAAQAPTLMPRCYFEPQPELLSGGGSRGIVAAVRQRLVYPPHSGLVCLTGRTFVKFTITPAGEVRHATVVKGLWPLFDSAAVQAVRQLPCFKPMPQAMFYTVPVAYSR